MLCFSKLFLFIFAGGLPFLRPGEKLYGEQTADAQRPVHFARCIINLYSTAMNMQKTPSIPLKSLSPTVIGFKKNTTLYKNNNKKSYTRCQLHADWCFVLLFFFSTHFVLPLAAKMCQGGKWRCHNTKGCERILFSSNFSPRWTTPRLITFTFSKWVFCSFSKYSWTGYCVIWANLPRVSQ